MPVVTETFALLPCSKATTTGLEGCAEHRILTLDQRINVLRHQVFTRLFDDAAKRRFIRAEVSWSTSTREGRSLPSTSRTAPFDSTSNTSRT
jgi:hypothetical protein